MVQPKIRSTSRKVRRQQQRCLGAEIAMRRLAFGNHILRGQPSLASPVVSRRFVVLCIVSAGFCLGAFVLSTASIYAKPQGGITKQTATVVAPSVKTITQNVTALQALEKRLSPQLTGNTCAILRLGEWEVSTQQPNAALIPASGLKLVTMAAVNGRLGSNYRLATTFYGVRDPNGVVDKLYVVGGGDPLITTEAYAQQAPVDAQEHTSLNTMVKNLYDEGVRQINTIVLDDSRYDNVRINPAWKTSFVPRQVAPIGPLIVNDNHSDAGIGSVDDPALFFGARFAELANAQQIGGAKSLQLGQVPKSTPQLLSVKSLPLNKLVANTLANSNNTSAEMLLKELGRQFGGQGTTKAGLDAVRSYLDEKKVPLEDFKQIDGSGLSPMNRVTCTTLDAVTNGALANQLAIAGKTGTLRDRLAGTPAAGVVAAKTGTLVNAGSLSGLTTQSGQAPLHFVVISNNERSVSGVRGWQDSILGAVASFLQARADNLG